MKRPRLPAYPRTDGVPGLRVWCCWCDRWHSHSDASPYTDTGYVLTNPAILERAVR